MVNWGVIGAGGIARRRTIPEGIIPAENSKLAAVMDTDKKAAQEVAEKYQAKAYFREKDLVRDSNVDAVYIATPVYLHAKQTIMALEAGKNVLCEKPMALTISDCEKMIKTAEKYKKKLGIGYFMRFHAYHQKFKEMVKKGDLGKIVLLRGQLSCWYPKIEGAWRQSPKLGGGGSLIDMGNHCLDTLECILDSRVKEVSCFTGSLVQDYPVEDSALLSVRFENGALGVVDTFFSIPDNSSKNRLEIYGSRGSILAEGTIGQLATGEAIAYLEKETKTYEAEQKREESAAEEIKPFLINGYKAEIEAFAEAIEKDTEPPISGEDGLWSQKIVLAAYQSAKTGKRIKLS